MNSFRTKFCLNDDVLHEFEDLEGWMLVAVFSPFARGLPTVLLSQPVHCLHCGPTHNDLQWAPVSLAPARPSQLDQVLDLVQVWDLDEVQDLAQDIFFGKSWNWVRNGSIWLHMGSY